MMGVRSTHFVAHFIDRTLSSFGLLSIAVYCCLFVSKTETSEGLSEIGQLIVWRTGSRQLWKRSHFPESVLCVSVSPRRVGRRRWCEGCRRWSMARLKAEAEGWFMQGSGSLHAVACRPFPHSDLIRFDQTWSDLLRPMRFIAVGFQCSVFSWCLDAGLSPSAFSSGGATWGDKPFKHWSRSLFCPVTCP